MAKRGFIIAGSLLGLAFASAGASADDLVHRFAPRCMPEALGASTAPADPCAARAAVFGPSGPTVLAGTGRDVETTGSLGPRTDAHRRTPAGER